MRITKKQMDEITVAAAQAAANSLNAGVTEILFRPLLTAHLALAQRVVDAGLVQADELIQEMDTMAALEPAMRLMADAYRTGINKRSTVPPAMLAGRASPAQSIPVGEAGLSIKAPNPTPEEAEALAQFVAGRMSGEIEAVDKPKGPLN